MCCKINHDGKKVCAFKQCPEICRKKKLSLLAGKKYALLNGAWKFFQKKLSLLAGKKSVLLNGV